MKSLKSEEFLEIISLFKTDDVDIVSKLSICQNFIIQIQLKQLFECNRGSHKNPEHNHIQQIIQSKKKDQKYTIAYKPQSQNIRKCQNKEITNKRIIKKPTQIYGQPYEMINKQTQESENPNRFTQMQSEQQIKKL